MVYELLKGTNQNAGNTMSEVEKCNWIIPNFVLLQAEENLGMVMVFTLVSAAQEKLNEFVDQLKQRKEEEKLRKEREEEEREKTIFTGTHVTFETFMKWRTAFEKEINSNKKDNNELLKGKLTGWSIYKITVSCM